MNSTPICNAIRKYQKAYSHKFHTPGHVSGRLIPSELLDWGVNVFNYDLTEVDGLDNLLYADGVIKESQELTAKLLGADNTLYLTQGSTLGIQIAIMSTITPGDKVIVQRQCHLSVYNALILSGAIPIWINCKYDINGQVIPLSNEDILSVLLSNSGIKAVVIQNPTYEGKSLNIKDIVKTVHSFNIPIIVDEAHGAHFSLYEGFPTSAVSVGADLVIQSAHKTLPVLTGGAYLHYSGKRVLKEDILFFQRVLQSSSPSYLILSSLDAAQEFLHIKANEIYKDLHEQLNFFYSSIIDKQIVATDYTNNDVQDFSKINLIFSPVGYHNCINMLKKCGIMFEKSDGNNILFITTPGNSTRDLEMLSEGLNSLYLEKECECTRYDYSHILPITIAPQVSPRDVVYYQKVWVNISKASGRVSADSIIVYPPGTPVIMPGEVITKEAVDYLVSQSSFSKVIGLKYKEGKMLVRVLV